MDFSKVTGYIKDKFRGGSKTVSVSKIESKGLSGQVLNCFGPGIELNPADNTNLTIQKIGGFTVAVGGVNQEIEPDTERGELRLYSTDEEGKIVKASIKFKNDGGFELLNDKAVIKSDPDGNIEISNEEAIITLKDNGDIELNDASDSAVLFSELKTAYDGLKSKLNDLITKYNAYIHITTATIGPTAVPGVISPTVSIETPSTDSVDSAESADVKLS